MINQKEEQSNEHVCMYYMYCITKYNRQFVTFVYEIKCILYMFITYIHMHVCFVVNVYLGS